MGNINDPDCTRRLLNFRIGDATNIIESALPYIGYKRMGEIQKIVEDEFLNAYFRVWDKMNDRIEENVSNALAAQYVIEGMFVYFDFSKLHNEIELIEMEVDAR